MNLISTFTSQSKTNQIMAKKSMYTGTDLATVSNENYTAVLSDLGDNDIMIRTQVGEYIMTHCIMSIDVFGELVKQIQSKATTIAELDKQGLI